MIMKVVIGYVALVAGWLAGGLLVFALMAFGVPSTGGDIAVAVGLGAIAVGGVVAGRLLVDAGRAERP